MSTGICVSLPAPLLRINFITTNIISLVWRNAAGFNVCVCTSVVCVCVESYMTMCEANKGHQITCLSLLLPLRQCHWACSLPFWISHQVSEVQWPSCLHPTQNCGYRSMPVCMHAPHVCFMWVLGIRKSPCPLNYLPVSPSIPLFFLPCLLEIESGSLCSPSQSGTH